MEPPSRALQSIPARAINENFEFSDLLGAADEYLIKYFADSAGKKGEANSIRSAARTVFPRRVPFNFDHRVAPLVQGSQSARLRVMWARSRAPILHAWLRTYDESGQWLHAGGAPNSDVEQHAGSEHGTQSNRDPSRDLFRRDDQYQCLREDATKGV